MPTERIQSLGMLLLGLFLIGWPFYTASSGAVGLPQILMGILSFFAGVFIVFSQRF